jgi:hypothetical protein
MRHSLRRGVEVEQTQLPDAMAGPTRSEGIGME